MVGARITLMLVVGSMVMHAKEAAENELEASYSEGRTWLTIRDASWSGPGTQEIAAVLDNTHCVALGFAFPKRHESGWTLTFRVAGQALWCEQADLSSQHYGLLLGGAMRRTIAGPVAGEFGLSFVPGIQRVTFPSAHGVQQAYGYEPMVAAMVKISFISTPGMEMAVMGQAYGLGGDNSNLLIGDSEVTVKQGGLLIGASLGFFF